MQPLTDARTTRKSAVEGLCLKGSAPISQSFKKTSAHNSDITPSAQQRSTIEMFYKSGETLGAKQVE